MEYIHNPNLPSGSVQMAVVDGRLEIEREKKLLKLGIRVLRTKKHIGVYDAISYHPDIMLHHIGGRTIVFAPGTDIYLVRELECLGFNLIRGASILKSKYPYDIAYNVARVGNFAFHNLKYTDPVIKREMDKIGVELVHVNQGYSKCATSIVDEKSIITSDKGIAKAAESKDIEALLIEPEESIMLPGLDYGFIGGSSGLIDNKKWAIAGNIEYLKQSQKICDFLYGKNVEIVSLFEGKVMDIGSIIPILQKNKA